VKKTVKVLDDYFTPVKVTVPRESRIVWKWGADNGNTHDVKLKSGPKGVKKFHSDPATTDFTFRRTLKKRGKYVVICTYHRTVMRQTIVVK
jgi:plastocyanin